MPTFDYSKAEAMAQKFITKYGRAATVVRPVVTDNTRPSEPVAGASTLHPCTLAPLDAMTSFDDADKLADELGKVYISTEGLTITLNNKDTVRIDDPAKPYRIEELNALAPGGLITVYIAKLVR